VELLVWAEFRSSVLLRSEYRFEALVVFVTLVSLAGSSPVRLAIHEESLTVDPNAIGEIAPYRSRWALYAHPHYHAVLQHVAHRNPAPFGDAGPAWIQKCVVICVCFGIALRSAIEKVRGFSTRPSTVRRLLSTLAGAGFGGFMSELAGAAFTNSRLNEGSHRPRSAVGDGRPAKAAYCRV
jgi:hypothetical protein